MAIFVIFVPFKKTDVGLGGDVVLAKRSKAGK
jgi:hypothetical protein